MTRPELHRESGGRILGMAGTASSPDNGRVPKHTPGPLGMSDHFAPAVLVATRGEDFEAEQGALAGRWGRFVSIVHDYLGIPYKKDGRAVRKVTGRPAGIATDEKGLVCTSFVDVVLSRYLYEDPERQLDNYKFGDKPTDIFDQYAQRARKAGERPGLKRLPENIEPKKLAEMGLSIDRVYGVVFHMKDAWIKTIK